MRGEASGFGRLVGEEQLEAQLALVDRSEVGGLVWAQVHERRHGPPRPGCKALRVRALPGGQHGRKLLTHREVGEGRLQALVAVTGQWLVERRGHSQEELPQPGLPKESAHRRG